MPQSDFAHPKPHVFLDLTGRVGDDAVEQDGLALAQIRRAPPRVT